jgi:hypothetical protein
LGSTPKCANRHAGPKLSGYATTPATTATVAQNAAPGFCGRRSLANSMSRQA